MVDLPDWSALDANDAPPLEEHLDRPGRIVVVLATDRCLEDGWALRSTLDIARSWGASGHKIVVADGMLEAPTLHSFLGLTNTEGVADAVLYGSSVRRIAKPAPQGSYFFVTAGSPTSDPVQVFAGDRWRDLCDGFVEAGVALLLFTGARSPGLAAALGSATDVLVLKDQNEDVLPHLEGVQAPVRFVLGPQPAPEPEPEPEPTEEDAAVAAALAALDVPAEPKARGTRGPLVLALSAIILGIVGAATFDIVTIPGISPSTRGPRPAVVEEGATVAVSNPIAETTLRLSHSVAVGAFQDLAVAEERAGALSTDGVLAIVVPVSIDDSVLYRVLLDPAEDVESAEGLSLDVGMAVGEASVDWVVRESSLGFEVGETADLESAQRRVEVLRDLDVPAYVLAVDFVNGSTRFRVYAGAYANDQEASYLRSHLEERGLGNLTLSDRIGRLPE